jgi:hypothetical protein
MEPSRRVHSPPPVWWFPETKYPDCISVRSGRGGLCPGGLEDGPLTSSIAMAVLAASHENDAFRQGGSAVICLKADRTADKEGVKWYGFSCDTMTLLTSWTYQTRAGRVQPQKYRQLHLHLIDMGSLHYPGSYIYEVHNLA